MEFKQFYLGCLAHASYLVGDEGEAAIVDPQRDVQIYLDEAQKRGLKITHVIETHLHADFVSGHLELAQRTGAKICFGHRAEASFDFLPIHDGDVINLRNVQLRFLETPGHTPESISVLISNQRKSSEPQKVLTGDTLFIGDVGRPDLVSSKGFSSQDMAGMLFDSLHQKLLKLSDDVEVYPAHGAGSACGRNISDKLSSTIGEQRKFNYALQKMSKEEFIKMMTNHLAKPPAYFPHDAEMNRNGAQNLENLLSPPALSAEDTREKIEKGAWILDVRNRAQYGEKNIPGSVNIGIDGNFAPWVGAVIPSNANLVLVSEDEKTAQEATMRLARIGFENVIGYLNDGVAAWENAGFPIQEIKQISVGDLSEMKHASGDNMQVLDVRRNPEFKNGHISSVHHLPLQEFQTEELSSILGHLDPEKPTAVICAGGYRSSIACGFLAQKNFTRLYNVQGGMNAWKEKNLPILNEN